ncbi:MAG: hypothetical protein FWG04_02695 [Desulfovibrionaceae bacterium]|nr:hypothetical protein [Desulfovibrionaceae bacterium]
MTTTNAVKMVLLGGVVLACFGAAYWVAYSAGYGKAEAEGRASLNALKVERAEEQRRAAEAYGEALADILTEYQNEVARGDALAVDLQRQDREHNAQTQALQRRIAHVAQNSTVTLGPDVVRLLNEAAGLSDAALSAALCAPGADGEPAAHPAPRARILEGVNEADLIAWFAEYAERARWLESRLLAWQAWYRGLKEGEQSKGN